MKLLKWLHPIKDKKIIGCEGIVEAMSQNEDNGQWGYAVSIFAEGGLVWDVMEEDLLPTGKMSNPENHKPVGTIKVQVDPETGEGSIKEDD